MAPNASVHCGFENWNTSEDRNMNFVLDHPLLVFALSLLVLSLATWVGDTLRSRVRPLKEEEREQFSVVLSATLTLLGLLIAFSFSMAVSRYDQRKNYEEAEANAIGTEYVRADLLPSEDAARVRGLLDSERALARKDQHGYVRTAERVVVHHTTGGGSSAYLCGCPRGRRHERRVELAGIYAGGVVEPHPNCSVGVDGGHRLMLLLADRVRCAPDGSAHISAPADCCVHRLLPDC